MLNLETVFSNPILKQSNNLLKVRICFYSISYVHLVVVASLLLTIDFSKSEDPNIRLYQETRWKLITAWFNESCVGAAASIISVVYDFLECNFWKGELSWCN